MKRDFGFKKKDKGIEVTQVDTQDFLDDKQVYEYIERQERELERLRKQRDHLNDLEVVLANHIAALRKDYPSR